MKYSGGLSSPTRHFTRISTGHRCTLVHEEPVKAGNEATADVISHRTSPDAPSSIGPWKRDLEPRLQKICDEALGGLLDELGAGSC